MYAQMESIVKFAIEIAQRDIWLGHRLQYHFGLRSAMFHQQYLSEPAFTNNLDDVKLIHKLYLIRGILSNVKIDSYLEQICGTCPK